MDSLTERSGGVKFHAVYLTLFKGTGVVVK